MLVAYRPPLRKEDAEDAWAWAVKTSRRFAERMREAFLAFRLALLQSANDLPDDQVVGRPDLFHYYEAQQIFVEAWRDAVGDVVLAAGNHADAVGGLGRTFSLDNPYTQEWLAMHGAELVTEVSWQTQLAIRQEVYLGVVRQQTVAETARRVRQMIGLNAAQQEALENARQRMIDSGMKDANVFTRVERLARQKVAQRAETIARTETMEGLNAGQHTSWQAARDKGLIGIRTVREWVAGVGSDRTCPICLDFAGTTATMDGDFVSRSGRRARRPGAHPGCRCSQRLKTTIPREGAAA